MGMKIAKKVDMENNTRMLTKQYKSQKIEALSVLCCAFVLLVQSATFIRSTPANNYNEGSLTSLRDKAILLSTGNKIKIYQYLENDRYQMSSQSEDLTKIGDESWITSIDYYYDESKKPYMKLEQDNISSLQPTKPPNNLCMLWLDANSNSIYKSSINHSISDGKILLSNKSSHRGTPIYVNHQHKLNLGHLQNVSTTVTTQEDVIAHDFIVNRESKKLFVSTSGPMGHQISVISLLNIDLPEKVFSLRNGPATHLQVDQQEHLIFYLDKFLAINLLNLTTGSGNRLQSELGNLPSTLTLDVDAKRIYWIITIGTIWSMRYNGTDKRCMARLQSRRTPFEPFSMKLINNRLFFSDIYKRSLFSVSMTESLGSNTNSCLSTQGTEDVLVEIVESPTVYSFHFVDSFVLHQEEEVEKYSNRLEESRKMFNLVYGNDENDENLPTLKSDHHGKLFNGEHHVSHTTLSLSTSGRICLVSMGVIIIVAILVCLIFKTRHVDSDGLMPIVGEI